MPEHPYGLLSLLPPVVAIGLAIASRRVIVSLLAGVFAGALILAGGDPVAATIATFATHLGRSLCDGDHLRVFAFTLLMGAMVGVVQRSGGMHGVVDRLAPLARSRRGGQMTTWALGLLIFFDDYANTLLLGGTMRPLADRLKISREKLAYLVDSTAAPVAGLALVSTWVAGEIGYIESGLKGLTFEGGRADALAMFIATIPCRFYVLWALAFAALVAWLDRDFGPMLRAERRAATDGSAAAHGRPPAEATPIDPDPGAPRRWQDAVVPVALTVAAIVCVLVITGVRSLGERPPSWLNILGSADSYSSLVVGSLAGLAAAVFMAACGPARLRGQVLRAAWHGAKLMVPALGILWLAWSLSGITDRQYLATGDFLGALLERVMAPAWMPTIVFVIASAVAFATGTSWGTMGILMPLVIQVTYRLLTGDNGPARVDDPILVASIGSVLAGAIFGDHCSPISDTTVLSSLASGCDHVAHVWTQLPYALAVGVVSIVCGTVPVGLGLPAWPLLPAGVVVLGGMLLLVGRRVEAT